MKRLALLAALGAAFASSAWGQYGPPPPAPAAASGFPNSAGERLRLTLFPPSGDGTFGFPQNISLAKTNSVPENPDSSTDDLFIASVGGGDWGWDKPPAVAGQEPSILDGADIDVIALNQGAGTLSTNVGSSGTGFASPLAAGSLPAASNPPAAGPDTQTAKPADELRFPRFDPGPGEAAGRRMAEEARERERQREERAEAEYRDRSRPIAEQLQEADQLRSQLENERRENNRLNILEQRYLTPGFMLGPDMQKVLRLQLLDRRIYGTERPTPEQIAKGPRTDLQQATPGGPVPGTPPASNPPAAGPTPQPAKPADAPRSPTIIAGQDAGAPTKPAAKPPAPATPPAADADLDARRALRTDYFRSLTPDQARSDGYGLIADILFPALRASTNVSAGPPRLSN